jgi:Calcineurin-like phosphoesterase
MGHVKMVGWYDPGQLARTAVQVVVSTMFGENADFRIIEALAAPGAEVFYDHTVQWRDHGPDGEEPDPTRPRPELWIDYVGDLGDGWNPTYAMAYQLVQPTLTVTDGHGRPQVTRRGEVLVFGGDEVYPTASRSAYRAKLLAPYEAALASTEPPHPHLFAVPGNHDWYDSLVAFTRLFCMKRWFAGWRTQQCRSYFAARLPHGWWLLGTDVQLGSDVDTPQIEYFKRVAERFERDDRIILCNAEPHWIYSAIYGAYDSTFNEGNLAFLEDHVLGRKISVFLAGDLHHYRRHEADDGTQKITSGGGGAFLHPTHGPDVSAIEERTGDGQPTGRTFRLRCSWPRPSTSRVLGWRNLLFPFINPWFGFVPAVLYVLISWTLLVDLADVDSLGGAVWAVFRALVGRPGAVFLVVLVPAAFVLFTDTHSLVYRWIAGLTHGFSHLTATFLLGWGVTSATVRLLGLPFGSPAQLLLAGFGILLGGWLVSGLIMGVYLLISLNVFARHSNEAFSSLRIQDWKHWLRLHIDANGDLTIFPIGVAKVPRRWVPSDGGGPGPRWVPVAADAQPALLEDPIVIRRAATAGQGVA